jgi:hypothetical protein
MHENLDAFLTQLDGCKGQIEQLFGMDTSFMKYFRYGMNLLSHLDFYYEEASLEVKRKLIGSIFPEKLVLRMGVIEPRNLMKRLSLSGSSRGSLWKKSAGQVFPTEKMSGNVPMTGLEPALCCQK